MAETLIPPRRVTVVAPNARVDVALPADATVAELVPQLAQLLNMPQGDPGARSGGWLLSRLGREPFDAARSVATLDLQDGELLYLVPRSQRMPPAVFDDIIDALAAATTDIPGGWSALALRRSALAAALVLSLAGVAVLLTAAPLWQPVLINAAVLCLVLTAGAGALSRVLADARAGVLAGGAALVFGALAGVALFAGDAGLLDLPGLSLLGATVVTAVLAVGLAILVMDGVPIFAGVAAVSAVTAVATAVTLLQSLPTTTTAAVTGSVLILCWPLLATLSLRLSRIPIPTVPANVEDFRTPPPTTPEDLIERRAAAAAGLLGALQAAVTVLQLGNVSILVRSGGRWELVLAALLAGALLLRSRAAMRGSGQRLTLFTGGGLGLLAVAAVPTLDAEPAAKGWIAMGLVLAAVIATAVALRAPGRRPSPYWGRFYDVLDFLVLTAVFPMTALITGLYARVRGFGG